MLSNMCCLKNRGTGRSWEPGISSLLHLGDILVYENFLKVNVYTGIMYTCEGVYAHVCGLQRLTPPSLPQFPSTLLFSEARLLIGLGSLIFLDCCVVSKPQAAPWSRSLDPPSTITGHSKKVSGLRKQALGRHSLCQ